MDIIYLEYNKIIILYINWTGKFLHEKKCKINDDKNVEKVKPVCEIV
jgi:hypothetical protein